MSSPRDARGLGPGRDDEDGAGSDGGEDGRAHEVLGFFETVLGVAKGFCLDFFLTRAGELPVNEESSETSDSSYLSATAATCLSHRSDG